MTENKNAQQAPSFKRKLGNATYTVKVHLNKGMDKTFKDSVQKLIINECLEKIRNNTHYHLTKLIKNYQLEKNMRVRNRTRKAEQMLAENVI